jgi:glycosyltransferase involved in cell wall biosynthesis
MKRRVVFLQKAPTPYNDYLFRAVSEDTRMTLEVHYLWSETTGRPWKTDLGTGYTSRLMRVRGGLDWKLLRQAWSDRDSLYIVGDWAHLPTLSVVLCRLIRGRPVALRVDTPQEQLPRRQPKKWLRSRFLHWLLPRVDRIFATSEPAFRVLESMGAKPDQLVDFPFYTSLTPSVDTNSPEWSPRRTAMRANVGCGDSDLVFVMVGTIFPKKGMDLGVRAFAQFQSTCARRCGMLIAGDGPQRNELEQLICSLGIASSVKILGWQEPEGLEATILASDAMIHAARYDPFPVAVLDAMRLGRPVIGSDVCGSVQARVVHGENGLVFPSGDVDALAACLARVGEQPELLLEWGASARRVAEEWPVERGMETIWENVTACVPLVPTADESVVRGMR